MTITIANFTTISGNCFVNCMSIFYKIEVQTVILVCLTGLKSNWFKGYDTKCKYFYFWFFAILYKNTLLHFFHFFILWHNYCTNKDLDMLSTSKWPSEPQFCQRWTCICQKNGQKWLYNLICGVSFISKQSICAEFHL